jgi:hypothetical protein
MFLKKSQKSQLGQIIGNFGMSPESFTFNEDEEHSAITLRHKESDAYFDFSLATSASFNVEFAPSASTNRATHENNVGWNTLGQMLGSWVSYLVEELKAEDPWPNIETPDEFIDEPDTLFTPAELETIDMAVDASFERLISEANNNGLEKKIDDVLAEITDLKKLARTTPRSKWLDIFKDAVATKLIEWGLDLVIGTAVLKVLYEVAKPILKIVAGTQ